MKRRCPIDGELYSTLPYVEGEPTPWDMHVKWHVMELSVEADMYGDIRPDALDVDAFLDSGVIRTYQTSG